MYCGIDVGTKRSYAAVIKGRRVLYLGDYKDVDVEFGFAGIDAPLSFPKKGAFRECERLLLKMGIRLFPSGAPFFRKIALQGMRIAEELKKKGVRVYEVYPYATRVILNLAPKARKHRKDGLAEIIESLNKYVEIDEASHDEVDALIAALTVKMFVEGEGVVLKGHDGEIIVPKGEIQQNLLWFERI